MNNFLVGIDRNADAIVMDGSVYIFEPQRLERLFIDADEVKNRAPKIAATFTSGLGASLSANTDALIEKACSEDSIVGRRVERLNRQADLSKMTAAKLRAGLKAAKLPKNAFGTAAAIELQAVDHAVALIDIAADLYYQPVFETGSRRVAAFRRM